MLKLWETYTHHNPTTLCNLRAKLMTSKSTSLNLLQGSDKSQVEVSQ